MMTNMTAMLMIRVNDHDDAGGDVDDDPDDVDEILGGHGYDNDVVLVDHGDDYDDVGDVCTGVLPRDGPHPRPVVTRPLGRDASTRFGLWGRRHVCLDMSPDSDLAPG